MSITINVFVLLLSYSFHCLLDYSYERLFLLLFHTINNLKISPTVLNIFHRLVLLLASTLCTVCLLFQFYSPSSLRIHVTAWFLVCLQMFSHICIYSVYILYGFAFVFYFLSFTPNVFSFSVVYCINVCYSLF